jgi:hypothetical protein
MNEASNCPINFPCTWHERDENGNFPHMTFEWPKGMTVWDYAATIKHDCGSSIQ